MRGAVHQLVVQSPAAGPPVTNAEGQLVPAAPDASDPMPCRASSVRATDRTEGQRERGEATVSVTIQAEHLTAAGVNPSATQQLVVAGAGWLNGTYAVDEVRPGPRVVQFLAHAIA